ncbi:Kinesin light chain 3 [Rhizophlyctis rosea]|nr:Kinesin light chain 3 [Rhizophlyctis rosea]
MSMGSRSEHTALEGCAGDLVEEGAANIVAEGVITTGPLDAEEKDIGADGTGSALEGSEAKSLDVEKSSTRGELHRPAEVIESNTGGVQQISAKSADSPAPLPLLGVRVTFFNDFVQENGGRDVFKGLTTAEVCDRFVKPKTEVTKSLCEHLVIDGSDVVGQAVCFISHSWQYQFLDVVDAIYFHYFDEITGDRAETIVWFDLFSLPQHLRQKIEADWLKTTFTGAISAMRNVLMVFSPWDKPITLTRAWCVFELYACVATKSKFMIGMSQRDADGFAEACRTSGQAYYQTLVTMKSEMCQATEADDLNAIQTAIRDTVGFNGLDEIVLTVLFDWMVGEMRKRIDGAKQDGKEVDRAAFMCDLGDLFSTRQRDSEAKALYDEALDIFKGIGGDDHEVLVRPLAQLAKTMYRLGDVAGAEGMWLDVAERARHQLGENDPQTLWAIHNLAVIYCIQQEYSRALPLSLECLNRARRVCEVKPNDLDILPMVWGLGNLFFYLELYDEAEPLFLECVKKAQATLGNDHPYTVQYFVQYATVLWVQGQFQDAVRVMETVCDKSERAFGGGHETTLASAHMLAGMYNELEHYEAAVTVLEKCLFHETQLFGTNHSDTIKTVSDCAWLQEKLGNKERASELLSILAGRPLVKPQLDIMSVRSAMTPGRDRRNLNTMPSDTLHPFTMLDDGNAIISSSGEKANSDTVMTATETPDTESHPASSTPDSAQLPPPSLQAEIRAEIEKVERWYHVYRRVLGDKHWETMLVLNELAWWYCTAGDFSKGEPLIKRFVEEALPDSPENYVMMVSSLSKLAWLYDQEEQYEKAEQLYLRCFEIAETELAETFAILNESGMHPNTLEHLINLAFLYQKQKKFDLAEPLLIEHLRRWTVGSVLGPGRVHALYSTVLLYLEQGDIDSAEPLICKLLAECRLVYGDRHPNTVTSIKSLMLLLQNRGKHEKAAHVAVLLAGVEHCESDSAALWEELFRLLEWDSTVLATQADIVVCPADDETSALYDPFGEYPAFLRLHQSLMESPPDLQTRTPSQGDQNVSPEPAEVVEMGPEIAGGTRDSWRKAPTMVRGITPIVDADEREREGHPERTQVEEERSIAVSEDFVQDAVVEEEANRPMKSTCSVQSVGGEEGENTIEENLQIMAGLESTTGTLQEADVQQHVLIRDISGAAPNDKASGALAPQIGPEGHAEATHIDIMKMTNIVVSGGAPVTSALAIGAKERGEASGDHLPSSEWSHTAFADEVWHTGQIGKGKREQMSINSERVQAFQESEQDEKEHGRKKQDKKRSKKKRQKRACIFL